jgi:hypothetical protein
MWHMKHKTLTVTCHQCILLNSFPCTQNTHWYQLMGSPLKVQPSIPLCMKFTFAPTAYIVCHLSCFQCLAECSCIYTRPPDCNYDSLVSVECGNQFPSPGNWPYRPAWQSTSQALYAEITSENADGHDFCANCLYVIVSSWCPHVIINCKSHLSLFAMTKNVIPSIIMVHCVVCFVMIAATV